MKYILFSFLIISSVGYGQTTTLTYRNLKDFQDSCGGCLNGTMGTDGKSLYVWQQPNFDTVKVIMLVCNTAIDTFQVTPQVGGNPYDYLDFDYSVKWQVGYEVIKSTWHRCCDPNNKLLAAPYFEYSHMEYLDAIKQKLSGITVWMSKELK